MVDLRFSKGGPDVRPSFVWHDILKTTPIFTVRHAHFRSKRNGQLKVAKLSVVTKLSLRGELHVQYCSYLKRLGRVVPKLIQVHT